MTPRADCQDCPWTEEAEDLVGASDAAERHERKEMHDVRVERVATDGSGETHLDEDGVILSIHIADGEGGSTDFGFGVTTSRHLVRAINAGVRVDEVFERLPDNRRDKLRLFSDRLGEAASKRAQTDGGRAVHAVQQYRGMGDQGLCPNGSRDCPDEHGLPCSDCFLGGDHGE
ncbi:hypothetical protein [Haloarcula pelagica]|uniref:hypothetical protein n=1 Tax=Haloarcula pelagica TaxID=3033389 RepID=UPI0024C3AE8E|nr:hypothetical protein [Halomicroarcula sp. YJ-61-S]